MSAQIPIPIGSKAKAGSVPVTIATDQGAIAVSGAFYQATQPVSGTIAATQSGTWTVTGPLTDVQLRATAIPVSGTFYQATQPISGTVTANIGTSGSLALDTSVTQLHTDLVAATPAGTNLIGKVGIDQTTPGTTNKVSIGTDGTVAATQSGTWTVSGNVASGASDSGNPVKAGAVYNSTLPTLTTGQRGDLQMSARGILSVQVMDGNTAGTPSAVQLGANNTDGASAPSGFPIGRTLASTYNGSTWDRVRGNIEITVLASAARTSTTNSSDQTNHNGRGLQIVLSVTAASGAGGLTLDIQGKDSISGSYYKLTTSPTGVTATGLKIYNIYPGESAAASGDITARTSATVPRTWRVAVTHGDASSYTYSISAVILV